MDLIRERFVDTAKGLVGKPYIWGKDNPFIGFDCSGFACYCLNDIGIVIKRTNAQGIFDFFKANEIPQNESRIGCLWFYGNTKQSIDHIMIVIDKWYLGGGFILCGARGGDSDCTNIDTAYKKKAMVDVVTGDYWSDRFICSVDPLLGV